MRRAVIPALLLSACCWLAFSDKARTETAPGLDADEAKLLFVCNFAKFTTWPAKDWEAGRPLRLGIADYDAVSNQLTRLHGKVVQGRKIEIVDCRTPDAAASCQVVFLNTQNAKLVESYVATLQGRPVLTVGNIRHGASRGLMINLFAVEDKLRFEINNTAVTQAQLRLSSDLLIMAKPADTDPAPAGGSGP